MNGTAKGDRGDLGGRGVLITGGAHGLGRALAFAFASRGAKVAVADLHAERLERTIDELRSAGAEVDGIQVDLRDREAAQAMVDRAEESLGGIDVLVNNAGVVHTKLFGELTTSDIENMMQVNLLGPIWVTRRALPRMLERRRGHIVNIASAAGKTTNPYMSVYSATKYGLVGLTDALHQELHGTGVSTTLVNPGWLSSGMFKGAKRIKFITRWTTPEEAAGMILDAVMKGKAELHIPRMMWIGGFLRNLLGPRVMDRLWRLFKGDRLFADVKGYE